MFSSYFTASPDRQLSGAGGNKMTYSAWLNWAWAWAELSNFQAMEVSWLVEFCSSNVLFRPTEPTLRPTQHRFVGVPAPPWQSLIPTSWTQPFASQNRAWQKRGTNCSIVQHSMQYLSPIHFTPSFANTKVKVAPEVPCVGCPVTLQFASRVLPSP